MCNEHILILVDLDKQDFVVVLDGHTIYTEEWTDKRCRNENFLPD